jgi:hypothetical protein
VEEKRVKFDKNSLWKGRNWKLKVEQKEYLESNGEVEKIKGRNKTESLVGRRRRKGRIREEIEVRRGIKEIDIAYSAVAT